MNCDSRYCLCKILISTFIVAAILNLALRHISNSNSSCCNKIKNAVPFLKNMSEYFKRHTVVSSALVAGLIAVICQALFLQFMKFPQKQSDYLMYLSLYFGFSAVCGVFLRQTPLFPHLKLYYYNHLGLTNSMYYDGICGVLIQSLLIGLYKLNVLYLFFVLFYTLFSFICF